MFDARQYVKSEWLHGEDLPDGEPVPVQVKAVYEHTFERDGSKRAVVEFVELDQKLVLNKTQTRKMIELFGANAGAWIDQHIRLMAAPSNFEGKPTILIGRGAPPQADQAPSVRFEGQSQPAQAKSKPVHPEVDFQ